MNANIIKLFSLSSFSKHYLLIGLSYDFFYFIYKIRGFILSINIFNPDLDITFFILFCISLYLILLSLLYLNYYDKYEKRLRCFLNLEKILGVISIFLILLLLTFDTYIIFNKSSNPEKWPGENFATPLFVIFVVSPIIALYLLNSLYPLYYVMKKNILSR